MGYDKQTWANLSGGGTKLNATRLNHMEDGIEAGALKDGYGSGAVAGLYAPSGDAYGAPDQTIPNSVTTLIKGFVHFDVDDPSLFELRNAYDSVDGASGGIYDDASIWIAEPGLYEFQWYVEWDTSGTGDRRVWVTGWSDGAWNLAGMYGQLGAMNYPADLAESDSMLGSTVARVWGSQHVNLFVWQDSGTAVDVTYAELWIYKII